jgi:hypothetical protein
VVRSVLIDSGKENDNLPKYLGMELSDYINPEDRRYIIDCLIISHYHIDHLGGLRNTTGSIFVKSHIDVNYFRVSQGGQSNVPDANMTTPLAGDQADAYNRAVVKMMYQSANSPKGYIDTLRDIVARDKAEKINLDFGRLPLQIVLGTVNGQEIILTCVCGNGVIRGNKYVVHNEHTEQPDVPNNLNDISLGWLVHSSSNDFTYFTGGDLSGNNLYATSSARNIESSVAASVGQVTFAKINHHGSRTSTNNDFLGHLAPQCLVCFPFYLSSCNLPSVDVLQRVKDHRIKNVCFTSSPYYVNRFANYEEKLELLQREYTDCYNEFTTVWNLLIKFISHNIPIDYDGRSLIIKDGNTNRLDLLLEGDIKQALVSNMVEKGKYIEFKNLNFFTTTPSGHYELNNDVGRYLQTGTVSDLMRAHPIYLGFCCQEKQENLLLSDLYFKFLDADPEHLAPDYEFNRLTALDADMNNTDVLDDYLKKIDEGVFTMGSLFKRNMVGKISDFEEYSRRASIQKLVPEFSPQGVDYGALGGIVFVCPDPGVPAGRLYRKEELQANLGCYAVYKQ